MIKDRLLVAILAATTLVGACTTSSTKSINPISDQQTTYFADPEERELFDESERLHDEFVRKGLIYRDSALTRYINKVSTDIQPQIIKEKFELRFFVMRDPSVNAFALPNGNIYLNIGLLNRLDNESQLAFVMAHEAAHVINRHAFKSKVSRRNDIVGAHIADFFLAGTGLSYLAAVSNIASYSRDLETEADERALVFLSTTDYDLSTVVDTFDQLKEVKHNKDSTSIWASHPDALTRKKGATTYIETHGLPSHSDTVDSETFQKFKAELTEATLKMRLRLRQYQLAQETAEAAILHQGENALIHAYIGDSYRLRLENQLTAAQERAWLYDEKTEVAKQYIDDNLVIFEQQANTHYQLALQLSADNANAVRGTGLLLSYQGKTSEAIDYLDRYLSFEKIPDRRFIEMKVKQLHTTNNEK